MHVPACDAAERQGELQVDVLLNEKRCLSSPAGICMVLLSAVLVMYQGKRDRERDGRERGSRKDAETALALRKGGVPGAQSACRQGVRKEVLWPVRTARSMMGMAGEQRSWTMAKRMMLACWQW